MKSAKKLCVKLYIKADKFKLKNIKLKNIKLKNIKLKNIKNTLKASSK